MDEPRSPYSVKNCGPKSILYYSLSVSVFIIALSFSYYNFIFKPKMELEKIESPKKRAEQMIEMMVAAEEELKRCLDAADRFFESRRKKGNHGAFDEVDKYLDKELNKENIEILKQRCIREYKFKIEALKAIYK